MKRHTRFLAALILLAAVFGAMALAGQLEAIRADAGVVPANRKMAARLALTDLALFTEARYTRHPSQADHFSAFQDFPGSLDHFPAGSIAGPGQTLKSLERWSESRQGGR